METYYGQVRTPHDAIKLFEACRQGILPRVQRRLSEKERQAIRSGSVFVWDEREAGMRRWTDGKSWSASRVSGSFLTYREMEGKRGNGFPGANTNRRGAGRTPDSGRGSDEDQDDNEPDGYRYKADGLMKQSFSITTSAGQHLHLISYYARPQANQPDLPLPTTDPQLKNIVPVKGLYPESSFHDTSVPAMLKAPIHQSPYGSPHPVLPPPPGQGYPPQYVQPGYGQWPPSPVATPPYGHAHYASAYAQPPSLPAHHHHHIPPTQQYLPYPTHPSHHAYPGDEQRPSLPPSAVTLPPLAQAYPQPFHPSPHASQPRIPPLASPRSQQLQAEAREAVQTIDPSLNGRNPHHAQQGRALPALLTPQSHYSQHGSGASSTATPPSRALSVSPPQASHSETNGKYTNGGSSSSIPSASNKASLSALLHQPTPTNSEPNSANAGSNSASSSPKGPAPPHPSVAVNGVAYYGARGSQQSGTSHEADVHAIRALDKGISLR
ncbi:Gti1/Pac2 family-domain-containing protein [Diplogelasinospora grovesii]|uniref:Gti1/Pac2 family-domain-containing protein n=1 Tax=Diplogelasinospora grovesii TaxID=303347 RepID=A0AAN6ND33_9PEZI|nr:Gti1/Pac2 family-domain-containing protein [Diplogelasinospora grovesii]